MREVGTIRFNTRRVRRSQNSFLQRIRFSQGSDSTSLLLLLFGHYRDFREEGEQKLLCWIRINKRRQ